LVGRIFFTVVNALFILIGASIWLFFLGPLLWLPLLVRSLAIYGCLLLVHAIVSTPIKGSTRALEVGIAWYFSTFFGMLSHLGDFISDADLTDGASADAHTSSNNQTWPEWLDWVISEIWKLIKQTIWAIIFWTGLALLLSHLGHLLDVRQFFHALWQSIEHLK
jgi:hypothetical protein